MAEEDVKRLVFSFMKFLNQQKASHQGEVLEQIKGAQQVGTIHLNWLTVRIICPWLSFHLPLLFSLSHIQFMESAYGFALDDSAESKFGVEKDLLDIFVKSVGSASTPPPSAKELESMKTKAEERKIKGEANVVYTGASISKCR